MTTLSASLTHIDRAPAKPRIVKRNTFRYFRSDGAEVIRLHMTDIVVKHPNGRVVLNSGGWRTMTTKDRINTYAAPYMVYSKAGVWWVAERGGGWMIDQGARTVPFYDGMTLPDAFKSSAKGDAELKRQAKLKVQIAAYAKIVRTLPTLPLPDAGDCWLCSMRSAEGVSMGAGDTDHLKSHLAERYVHGSLLVNAMRDAGWTDTGIGYALHNHIVNRDRVAKAVTRYFKRHPGIA